MFKYLVGLLALGSNHLVQAKGDASIKGHGQRMVIDNQYTNPNSNKRSSGLLASLKNSFFSVNGAKEILIGDPWKLNDQQKNENEKLLRERALKQKEVEEKLRKDYFDKVVKTQGPKKPSGFITPIRGGYIAGDEPLLEVQAAGKAEAAGADEVAFGN